MGFIGSGAYVHGNGIQSSFVGGGHRPVDVSPKNMHDSVKPSDLMMSMIR